MFSLRQIQYFVTTVDRGSVTAAAKELGVSPQAVSKSVSDFERSLGRALFVRKATGLSPTPYGMSLYAKARQALREVREFEDFSRGRVTLRRSHMVMSLCIPKIANFASMSQKIATFLYNQTSIPATIDYGTIEQCVERLSLAEADAFITVGKTRLDTFEVNVIDSVDVGALMLKSHALAKKRQLALGDVAGVPLYLTQDFPFFDQTVLGNLKKSPLASGLILKKLTMSIHGIFNALATSSGCVIMPSIQGVDDWLPGTKIVPFARSELSRVPLCLVTPKEHKTEYGKIIEALLLPNRSRHFCVAQATANQQERSA